LHVGLDVLLCLDVVVYVRRLLQQRAHHQLLTALLKNAGRDDGVEVNGCLLFLDLEEALSQLDGGFLEELGGFDSFWVVLLYECLYVYRTQILHVDVAHLVLLALVDVPERAEESEVFLLSADHLGCKVQMLEDAVVADHHWNNRHLACDARQ